ncbi:PHD finger protein 7-like [Gymnogyps californianus]|uniref:PHD finger protein 7-like n=1 Tax=Gymnogyps californianus TaxID=33616 RepID=UPI0021C6F30F|nr:PHD finger protein 7-like [Gymnogyps californianus]
MKQQDPDSREQACMLCHRAEADPAICGCKKAKKGLCAHTYCLFLASGLFPQESRNGFLVEDTRRAIQEAAQKRCFVCGETGATITCRDKGCNRSFHLPCASEGECVTQFFGLYRSFCWQHRPEQAVQASPGQNSTCIICLGLVEDKKSYHTMVCPACQRAWFHRSCIQKQAIHAGACFRCLRCQNKDQFVMEMLAMGIRISKRQPSWDSDRAFGLIYQRHICCNASKCLCLGGREQAEEEGSWQLLLCSSCAVKGIHLRCSYLRNSATTWECDCCAGLGTASSDNSELAGPSTASQTAPLGPSCSSPVPESSSRSSHPGPDRIRHRSRLQRRAQKPYSRPAKHCRNSCVPAPTVVELVPVPVLCSHDGELSGKFGNWPVPIECPFVGVPGSCDQNLHPEESRSPRDLTKKIQEQKEELGLMADLRSRTRYYRPEISLGLAVGEAKLCGVHVPLPGERRWGRAGGPSWTWGRIARQQAGVLPCGVCQCKGYAGG